MNLRSEILPKWRGLGAVDPLTLVEARLQLHHALQIIVSAPISYLSARADDSHTNLEWLPAIAALGTNWLHAPRRLRFALRPETFSLIAVGADGAAQSEYALDGRTSADAEAWLRDMLAAAGYDAAALTTKKHYEIAPHGVASGAAYSRDVAAHAELAHYYANAHAWTSHIAVTRPGASEPRCWPHHFDLATLITLPEVAGRGTRTVGAGLSPGDDSFGEPYLYIAPYPHPPVKRLRPLGTLGSWHTGGWVGAVLRAGEVAARPDAARQAEAAAAFADAAIDACIAALN